MMAVLAELTDATFDQAMLQAPGPVLVDLWAEWCLPCKKMAHVLQGLADALGERLRVAKLDVQANPEAPARFGVLTLPTLVLFVGGQKRERLTGLAPAALVRQRLEPHLAAGAN
jgi:thioredoxin 1